MVVQSLDASRRRTSFPASPDGSLKDVGRRRLYPAPWHLVAQAAPRLQTSRAQHGCSSYELGLPPGTLGQVRRQTRVGLTSESLANSPLTKVGESSVDSEVAIATASEIATPSGTVSL